MVAEFARYYAMPPDAVLRLPARQFLAFRAAYAGYPDDVPEQETGSLVDMQRWREKYGEKRVPAWRRRFDAVHGGDGDA